MSVPSERLDRSRAEAIRSLPHEECCNTDIDLPCDCWLEPAMPAFLTALDDAEARGRAERDERVGEVVAALVARAEIAEAAVRRVTP